MPLPGSTEKQQDDSRSGLPVEEPAKSDGEPSKQPRQLPPVVGDKGGESEASLDESQVVATQLAESSSKDEEKPIVTPASATSTNPEAASSSRQARTGQAAIKRAAKLIRDGKAKQIVVLVGAGISTSAGIPDFRSPDTGLYHNLQKLNLPFPEAVFELNYFKQNPKPFWTLAKELYPGKHFPTLTHYFLFLLSYHDVLRRVFTQNIDTLEHLSGLFPTRIIEAHGSFATAHCLTCRKEASREHVLRSGVRQGDVVRCGRQGCNGLVKPDIVFFGEGLPDKFFASLSDLSACDLLIVIGTSLQVHPFARLPSYVSDDTPRLLINREAVGPFTALTSSASSYKPMLARLFGGGGDDEDERKEDMFFEGDADDGIRLLARELGWEEELDGFMEKGHADLKAKWEKMADELGPNLTSGPEVKLHTKAGEAEAAEKSQKVAKEVGKVDQADQPASTIDHEENDDGVDDLQRAMEKDLDLAR